MAEVELVGAEAGKLHEVPARGGSAAEGSAGDKFFHFLRSFTSLRASQASSGFS